MQSYLRSILIAGIFTIPIACLAYPSGDLKRIVDRADAVVLAQVSNKSIVGDLDKAAEATAIEDETSFYAKYTVRVIETFKGEIKSGAPMDVGASIGSFQPHPDAVHDRFGGRIYQNYFLMLHKQKGIWWVQNVRPAGLWPQQTFDYADLAELTRKDSPRKREVPIPKDFALKIAEAHLVTGCLYTVFAARDFKLQSKSASLRDGKWSVEIKAKCSYLDSGGDGKKYETFRPYDQTVEVDSETGEVLKAYGKPTP